MEDFHCLSDKVNNLKKEISDIGADTANLEVSTNEDSANLEKLKQRIQELAKNAGLDHLDPDSSEDIIQQINTEAGKVLFSSEEKSESDKSLDINKADLLIACLAGGLSVLVDFILVKVPKNMSIKLNGEQVHHEGSPLTAVLKKIGIADDGKEAKWIQALEKWFHVDYDPSIKSNIPGMYPKNHRAYSLGHDPGISGLIWGVKDIVSGTFSYIDKNGVLCIDKVGPSDLKKVFYAPLLWLGHIVSDVFTKQGIPIPGTCILRTFQIGSFGEKDRTLGQLITYMYEQGYDLRHLATMATCKLVIDLVLNIYTYLTFPNGVDLNTPLFEKEYLCVKKERKKRKLFFIAYSVAVAGNIGKVAAYQGSPFAINAAIWYEFAREAIAQTIIYFNDDNKYLSAIEKRHQIDETFERLLKQSLK